MKLHRFLAGGLTVTVLVGEVHAQTTVPQPAIIAPVIAGPAVSSVVLKASPGGLLTVYDTPTAAGWLYLFNATSAPSAGAVTAGTGSGQYEDCVAAPAGVTTAGVYVNPENFSVGIVAAHSSAACGTLTYSATAYLHGQVR